MFFQIVHEKTIENNKYAVILEINCVSNHQFANLFEKVVNKFFNVTCKKVGSEVLQKNVKNA